MTKAAYCTHCSDIFSPCRDWTANRAWRWCQCDHAAVRWLDGARGQLEVTAVHGPEYVRVLGLNNAFLEAAAGPLGATLTAEEWRVLHARCAEVVQPYYLFHESNRACWALVVAVGESGDVTFVPGVIPPIRGGVTEGVADVQ